MQHAAQYRLVHQMFHHPAQPKPFKRSAEENSGDFLEVFLLPPSKSLKYQRNMVPFVGGKKTTRPFPGLLMLNSADKSSVRTSSFLPPKKDHWAKFIARLDLAIL